MEKQSTVNIDLRYYEPINRQQREFHASKARHKMLIGGYGGGKSYPAIHESLFHCLENPKHEYLVMRNTWDVLEKEIQEDFLRVCRETGLIKKWSSEKHDLVLPNDTLIMFRPLSLKRANLKGMHLCGFLIDDPDVNRYQDDISFLWSRLRNPPHVKASRFQTIITSNWEGRNWLWKTYMQERAEGGDDDFAYWVCPTDENPTLPENYIDDMAKMHSQEWMDRYVYCKMDSHIGLIYGDFSRNSHHLDQNKMLKTDTGAPREDIRARIMAIDVGGTHPTCVLKMATDGAAIYIYDEWFRRGIKVSALGEYLQGELRKDMYNRVVIDPASARGEMTSGTSIKDLLQRAYGVRAEGANNDVHTGINLIKDLMQPAEGPPRIYIDCNRCPNLVGELQTYRYKEPSNMDFDAMGYEEVPVKKNDDAVDAMRYGVMYLWRMMRRNQRADFEKVKRDRNWEQRKKLRLYKENPEMIRQKELIDEYRKLGFSAKKIRRLVS